MLFFREIGEREKKSTENVTRWKRGSSTWAHFLGHVVGPDSYLVGPIDAKIGLTKPSSPITDYKKDPPCDFTGGGGET
jgi:hypothetical protein